MTIKRRSVNCRERDWQSKAHALLSGGVEVDLHNFDFDAHGESAEQLERAFPHLELWLDRDPASKVAHFRLKS